MFKLFVEYTLYVDDRSTTFNFCFQYGADRLYTRYVYCISHYGWKYYFKCRYSNTDLYL